MHLFKFKFELESEPTGVLSLSFGQFEMDLAIFGKIDPPEGICWKASDGLVSDGFTVDSDNPREIVVLKSGIYHIQVDGLTNASTDAEFVLLIDDFVLRTEKYRSSFPTTFRVAISLLSQLKIGDSLVFECLGTAVLESAVMVIRQLN
ncbi:hypothetical protein PINS_up007552 [Pythium insidiosum]|nr:hypothetical protein PINS_up007552 [Pythium insidiosum]